MKKTNDGGPAFPVTWQDSGGKILAVGGMSLRDYFAAKAMQGVLANAQSQSFLAKVKEPDESFSDANARLAYEYADAMLKAREEQ